MSGGLSWPTDRISRALEWQDPWELETNAMLRRMEEHRLLIEDVPVDWVSSKAIERMFE